MEGGAEAPPRGLFESRHLDRGDLFRNRFAGVFDRPFEGLPGLADDLLVSSDGTLGRHAQCVRLKPHVGRELPLALRLAVHAFRPPRGNAPALAPELP